MYIRSKEEEILSASLWQIWANLESLELRESDGGGKLKLTQVSLDLKTNDQPRRPPHSTYRPPSN